jgi:ATP-dependent DNA helicase RecQ
VASEGNPSALARDALGFDLRPEQREAVESVVAGRDTLVVMPTGSGKSAIYQVAGLALPGETLVVSPLIALQQDQLEALAEADVPKSVALHSGLRVTERRQALHDLDRDRLEFVLLAPEQLANDEVLERVRAAGPSLMVIDEAHCISEWGHDFRPEYLRLGAIAETLGRPTVLALTATASPPVRAEIVERLGLRDPCVVVHGFDRPNIRLAVTPFPDGDAKLAALLEAVVAAPKPGIVYAATRALTEEITAALGERGVDAAPYHAGLGKADRQGAHERFTADGLEVIVATTAFGMGVDKPNVRFVFHHDVPESVDSYYQEVGRGGRDGEPAEARLFYRPEDLGLRRFFAASGQVEADEIAQLVDVLREHDGPLDPRTLKEETGLSRTKIATAVGRLEDLDAAEVKPTGEVELVAEDVDVTAVAGAAAQAEERRREFERSRLEMMRGYAEARDCRRGYLLNYFGEPFEPPCGNCDNCEAGLVAESAHEPFALGTRVAHGEWGEGAVQRYEADKMVVLFDEAGYKTLDVDLVVERELLEPR